MLNFERNFCKSKKKIFGEIFCKLFVGYSFWLAFFRGLNEFHFEATRPENMLDQKPGENYSKCYGGGKFYITLWEIGKCKVTWEQFLNFIIKLSCTFKTGFLPWFKLNILEKKWETKRKNMKKHSVSSVARLNLVNSQILNRISEEHSASSEL